MNLTPMQVGRGLVRRGRRLIHPALRRAQIVALRGDRVECPLCGGRFRRFLAAPDRPNAICPSCESFERHRRLILFLREHTNLYSDKLRVMHFAPEPSLRTELSRMANLDYVTADLIRDDVDVQVDVTAMQFEDDLFDVIFCSHVLEHVREDRKAMRELRRVLRPDGWMIVDVPMKAQLETTYEDWSITTPEGRREAFLVEDHVRLYGRDFPDLLRSEGLYVEVDPHPASEAAVRRYGLSDADHINLCQATEGTPSAS